MLRLAEGVVFAECALLVVPPSDLREGLRPRRVSLGSLLQLIHWVPAKLLQAGCLLHARLVHLDLNPHTADASATETLSSGNYDLNNMEILEGRLDIKTLRTFASKANIEHLKPGMYPGALGSTLSHALAEIKRSVICDGLMACHFTEPSNARTWSNRFTHHSWSGVHLHYHWGR